LTDEGMSKKEWLCNIILTVLGIACFPINPLVLSGLVDPGFIREAYMIGWFVWGIGMVLVMAPIVMFPRRGGVDKGSSFVHTTKLVDTGIYGVVRHPQYLGGILSLFLTSTLWYPHWMIIIMGIAGSVAIYMGTIEEDRRLVDKFGPEYERYMERVPRMNLLAGIARKLGRGG